MEAYRVLQRAKAEFRAHKERIEGYNVAAGLLLAGFQSPEIKVLLEQEVRSRPNHPFTAGIRAALDQFEKVIQNVPKQASPEKRMG